MLRFFIGLLFMAAYSYLFYPLVLAALRIFRKRPWVRQDAEPSVSLVVSAYNEENVIKEKVLNALKLDYPSDKLEVVVCSDGSTDRTSEIVSSIHDPRITFYDFPQRSGKTACLNRIVPSARGEIVLFTDANSILPPDILQKIARNFSDWEIGLVTGWTRYRSPSGEEASTSVYARYEKFLKSMESDLGSCVGADGAIFAIRKGLYRTLRDDDINDFVIPLDVIRQGFRVVLDPSVYCFEDSSNAAGEEYQRQVRITTRTLWAIRRNLDMLNPLRYGSFSFFLLSHKVLRFLTPFFLAAGYILNACMLRRHPLSAILFLGQSAFLAAGMAGIKAGRVSRVIEISRMLLVTFAAQLYAWFRMLTGIKDTMWTPRQ